MTVYLLRRLLEMVPLLAGISLVVFVALSSIPGGPLTAYRSNPNVRGEDLARLSAQMGLDQPVVARYGRWLSRFVRGDWGYSIITQRPVLTMIGERLVNTLYLMAAALIITVIVAVPLGIYAAIRQYSSFDYAATGVAFMVYSIPDFWLGLLFILLFAVQLRWLPAGGMYTLGADFSIADRARYLILPTLTLALPSIGFYTRYLRAGVLEVKHQDYVRTAWAKGLNEPRVLFRHVLKNALIPFVTVLAIHLPQVFTGAIVVETIFGWPGMGRLYWQSALNFDYPVLMGVMTISAGLVLLANLTADLAYGVIDPRIRYD